MFFPALLSVLFVMAEAQDGKGNWQDRLDATLQQISLEISAHKAVTQQLENIIPKLKETLGQDVLETASKLSHLQMQLDEERDATFFYLKDLLQDVSPAVPTQPVATSAPVPNNDEKEFYNSAMTLQAEEKWEGAHEMLTKAWAAYNESEKLGQQHTIELIYIFEWLEYVCFKMDKIAEALFVCQHALTFDMNDFHKGRFQVSVDFYNGILAGNTTTTDTANENVGLSPSAQAKKLADSATYEACREDISSELHRNLSASPSTFCRFSNRGRHPLLLLSPLKEEILSLDPPIVFFHDIVRSWEGDELKMLFEETFVSAQILSHSTQKTKVEEETRKAEVAWIETEHFPSLTQRLEAITQLDPTNNGAETYQVSRYHIGGHYIAHFDMLFDVANETDHGDRIATLLVYLNDVEEGGGTVFTRLGVHVLPEAGGALFWYNQHRDESYDMRTLHAACPVLKGEKWIINKWFRFRGQFRHKTCRLGLEASSFSVEPV